MQITLNVAGMTCGHCEKAVKQAVLAVDPSAQVSVDRTQNKVQVDTTQSQAQIIQAIAQEGYVVQAA